METKIKAATYKKKLEAELTRQQLRRKKALAKYHVDFDKWKRDFTAWVGANYKERIAQIPSSAYTHYDYDSRHLGIDLTSFFTGMPERPKYPKDDAINEIRNLLRHLALQKATDLVTIRTGDLRKVFSEFDESDA